MPDKSIQLPDEQRERFLDRLRKETREMHDKLESTTLSKKLLEVPFSLDAYIRYLAAMQQVIIFSEEHVFPGLRQIVPDIESRRKASSIGNDLAFLDFGQQLPPYIPFHNEPPTAFLLGFMYVIEGSVLGGRVILKHLNKQSGIDENNGGSFFFGYGAETSSRWSSFIHILSSNAGNGSSEQIIEGAKTAFHSIHDYFEKIAV